MKVVFVIPMFNAAPHVKELVSSLQSQNKEKGYSLSYLDVFSTVREASGIPKEVW